MFSSPLLLLAFFFSSTAFSPNPTPLGITKNVTLYGDARFENNSISLTRSRSCLPLPDSSSGIGRAFYVNSIRFLDYATNATASFTCRFSFSITVTPMCPPGDGLTFLLTSDPNYTALHENGHLGLPPSGESFIAIEFDTSFDLLLRDINWNHIGIDLHSPISLAAVDSLAHGVDLWSGRLITAWIDYTDALKLIRVWIGYSPVTRPSKPVLAARVDLLKHFGEFMHVGFSASNGKFGSAIHRIYGLRFRTSGFSSVAHEGDCILCFESDSTHKKDTDLSDLFLGLGGLAAFLMSLLGFSVIGCWLLKKKRPPSTQKNIRFHKMPTTLTLSEVRTATAGFSPSRIIGEGVSATVYEGSLPSGETVAVKRFAPQLTNQGQLRDPFTTELATMVSCLRHKNLVLLQGWCCEGNELVLIYEYLPNGTLYKNLHERGTNLLTWDKRAKVVQGIASGLAYLHEECERQIIHRDVKSCNIFLDSDFSPKLGDFGLAEAYERGRITRNSTIPAGTMGYLAPEYVYSGVPTEKTDVYSFGVVILEVGTGRRPVEEGVVLSDWVWEIWGSGRLDDAADRRLRGRFDFEEMERMLMVGLWCVHPDGEFRPTVKDAARMMRGEMEVPCLPATKPGVVIRGRGEFLNRWVGDDESEEVEDDPLPLWFTPISHFGNG